MSFLKSSGGNFETRKKAADERLVERRGRTDEEQLRLLDKKLGKGNGAKKERERLLKKMGGVEKKVVVEREEVKKVKKGKKVKEVGG